ncbi:MAG: phage major capsid protein [Ruminococcus flavefaciens]|nr:phage major capsid protein [Ruminococcus flavefaciens]MCM1061474.1 phage major capsid protein [Eubacterium sp.]
MKKLIEKREALKAQLQAMLDKAKNEERAFTEEEMADFDKIEAEIKSVDATIKAEERAKGFADFHVPMAESSESKKEIEERAFKEYILGKTTEMRAGEQNVDMDNNGAVIPETIANRIIDAVSDLCPILTGADVYHVKGTLKIPKWTKANGSHDIAVGYSTEFKTITADSGKFDSVDLGGFLAGALTLVGRSVENNSQINIVDFVIRKMSEKIAEFMEGEFLNGNGTNGAQGALNCTNTVTTAKAADISLEDLVKLQSAVKQAFQKNACWTMSNSTFTLIKLLKDTNGRPLIEPDASKAFPYTLLGKPVYLSDNMPEAAAGAKTVLYGDYSGLSVNFRENISIQILREKYADMHVLGVISWFEFDSRITDEQKLAVLVQKSA